MLGAHVSIAGGLERAFERGARLGCEALQIFVKNASQWTARPLTPARVEAFREAWRGSPIGPVTAHAAYLINLCATDPATLERSRRALGDELDRCTLLGIPGLVVHPGAHLGAGEAEGLVRIAASLDEVLAGRPVDSAQVWLENTAGQGTVLGHRLEHLAAIRERVGRPELVGYCLDTCHAFAAGYAVHQAAGLRRFLDEVEDKLGLERVGCLHLNDSRHPLGSRKDRHANIGEGEIGRAAFRRLLAAPRLAGLPMLLETPLGADRQGHARDLATLRSLAA